jgi:hypothetical protein
MRAQKVGGAMAVVGTGVVVAGLSSMTSYEEGRISGGAVTALGGAYVASAGIWTLAIGSISREVVRQNSRRQRFDAQMLLLSTRESRVQQASGATGSDPPTSPAVRMENPPETLTLLVEDVCSLVPDECIAIRACLLYADEPACASVDALAESGELSPTVWRIARRAAGLDVE